MITYHSVGSPEAQEGSQDCAEYTRKAIWIDLFEPTRDEEKSLEAALGIDIPTREEMHEIEISSRLYKEDNALFITGTVLTNTSTEKPSSAPVTFILRANQLITLRYAEPKPFRSFKAHRAAHPEDYQNGHDVFAGLIDAIVDRAADILENVAASLDQISLHIFEAATSDEGGIGRSHPVDFSEARRKPAQRDFAEILRRIGWTSDRVSRARESLVSFSRVVAFYREMQKDDAAARGALVHLSIVAGDLTSLSDHATFMSGKISFLLEATLGMINNEQNGIIKIVSVAAVVFLPPTLVASVYGMNFEVMPELRWAAGYPIALLLMGVSAVLPYLIFKRKGWL